ncbi:MAG: peptidylprolyl isomerase [Pikeienuella sp.]
MKEYKARHILVDDEAEAAEIAGLARAEGADFAELAKERSKGPSGPQGGDLGWFTEGQMVAEFQAATFALEAGQVSDPVKTQFGWHVIKLEEIRDRAAPPLEEVREDLIGELTREETMKLLEELRAAGDIVIPEGKPGLSSLRDDSLIAE